jgi:ectoine hydroxylase-related dioxygenase (phytanoyl-CoA dioxygenase family)
VGKGRHQPLPEDEAREAIESFHRDGFAVVRGVLGEEECAFFRRRTDELAADPSVGPPAGSGGLFILRNAEQHDRAFVELFIREPALSLVRRILGPECRFCAQNVVRNPPGHAISHWHVDDILEYPLPPDIPRWDARVRLPVTWMSVQVPLTDVMTPESGPTEVVPGSHLAGRLPATENPVFEGTGAVPVLCRAGDIYLFNHQVWHRGGPNRSAQTRYLMQLQYGRGDSIAVRLQNTERTPALDRFLKGADPRLEAIMAGPPLHSAPGHFNRM